MLIQVYHPCHLTNPSSRIFLMAKYLQQCFSFWCQIDISLLNFGNAKRLCLFCLMTQKHCWNYFAFQPIVFGWRQNSSSSSFASWGKRKKEWFYNGGSGLDRTDDFQKFCESGLDRIQFYRFRTGSDSILSDQDWIGFNFIGSGLDSDCFLVWLSPYVNFIWPN